MKKNYLTFTMLLIFSVLSITGASANDWLVDSLSTDPYLDDRFTSYSFAIGPDNTYHFVFQRFDHEGTNENGGFTIYYMSKACGEEWSEPEPIHTLGESTVSPSIVCTDDGTVYVCYQRYMPVDYWSDVIYIAERTENGWEREQLPTPTDLQNWMPRMAADAEGNFHITWVATPPQDAGNKCFASRDDEKSGCGDLNVAYATNMSGQWETQLLEDIPLGNYGLGASPEIQVSPEGTVHMVMRGIDPHTDPEWPVYRIYYTTNLEPGGSTWEYQMFQTDMVMDEVGLIYLEEDKVHVAIGGSNSWESPNYSFYTVLEQNKWADLIRVNNLKYGYPTSLKADDEGTVFITYIAQYQQGYDHHLVLWEKTGNDIHESYLLEDVEVTLNDYIIDRQGNTLLPYLVWSLDIEYFAEWNSDTIAHDDDFVSSIPKQSFFSGSDWNKHLIFEKSETQLRNPDRHEVTLWHQLKLNNQDSWSTPVMINTPNTRKPLKGTASISGTKSYNTQVFIAYLSKEDVPDKGEKSEVYHYVIASNQDNKWYIDDVPFDLTEIEIIDLFFEIDGQDKHHSAVFASRVNIQNQIEYFIKYAVFNEDRWDIQEIAFEDLPLFINMEIDFSGKAKFIYTENQDKEKIKIKQNNELGGYSWETIEYNTEKPIENICTGMINEYLFVTTQLQNTQDNISEIIFHPVYMGEMLDPITVLSSDNSDPDLQSMSISRYGEILVSVSELADEKSLKPLKILRLINGSFNDMKLPEAHVSGSQPVFDDQENIYVITEQEIDNNQGIMLFNFTEEYDFTHYSEMVLLRSGDCETNTSTPVYTENTDIYVFPNPARNTVNIKINNPVGESGFFNIIDISGRIVYHSNIFGGDGDQIIPVDISQFTKGLYLLQISLCGEKQTKKFIVQ
jgi:hypothetical protein